MNNSNNNKNGTLQLKDERVLGPSFDQLRQETVSHHQR